MADKKSEKGNVIFYCKDCEEIVDTDRCGRKYVYKCKKCGTKNVAFGTTRSIHSFFHVKEDDIDDVDEAKVEAEVKKSEAATKNDRPSAEKSGNKK